VEFSLTNQGIEPPKAESLITGRITKVFANSGVHVQLAPGRYGRVALTELSDKYRSEPLKKMTIGKTVQCRVMDITTDGKQVDLSLRPSMVNQVGEVKDVQIRSFEDVKAEEVYRGYIVKTMDNGCFVMLGNNITARVQISNLSDHFIKDFKAAFPEGTLVKGRVLEVDVKRKRIEFSLKNSQVDPDKYKAPIMLSTMAVGQKLKGTVKKVESYGVFIAIENSQLSGLCHISESSDEFVSDLKAVYAEGDLVKAQVVKLDGKRISLGLKKSYFEGDVASSGDEDEDEEDEDVDEVDQAEDNGGDDDDENEGEDDDADDDDDEASEEGEDDDAEEAAPAKRILRASAKVATEDEDEDGEDEDGDEEDDGEDSEEDGDGASEEGEDDEGEDGNASEDDADDATAMEGDSVDDESDSEDDAEPDKSADSRKRKRLDAPRLEVNPGFSFAEGDEDEDEDEGQAYSSEEDDEDDSTDNTKKKTSKRAKRAAKVAEEDRVREEENALVDDSNTPQSPEAFDRLLLGSPNSSYLWVKYVAFYLQMTEIDNARKVAERALNTISVREEDERMNVWVARLNLENVYGTMESTQTVFAQAEKMNDSLKVHTHMTAIYEASDKGAAAEELHQKVCKKFRDVPDVWIRYGQFKMTQGKSVQARQVLQDALKALPKHQHIPLIVKFALMDFKNDEVERGRTILENVLANYPKRVDLWNVYLDQELRVGNHEVIRSLFERCTALNLSSKKMKYFFKRYLEFEKTEGDADTVEHVKKKAREYVESKMG